MCYAKPGPRCSGHTLEAVKRSAVEVAIAEKSGAMDVYIAAREKFDAAKVEWQKTPDGIKSLRANGENALAKRYESERRMAIWASKEARADKEWKKGEGTVPFRERANKRAEILYGSNTGVMLEHSDEWGVDGNGNPVSVLTGIQYIQTNKYGNNVIAREYLSNDDGLYSFPDGD